jgi:hypothetical protein
MFPDQRGEDCCGNDQGEEGVGGIQGSARNSQFAMTT